MTKIKTQLAILGAGPGGYAAAFYAADLGMDVTLVDSELNPGGVCLHRGCIPSKALLHVAKILEEAGQAKNFGLEFSQPIIHLDQIREWKNGIVKKLTTGLSQLSKIRKIRYLQGKGSFENDQSLKVICHDGKEEILEFHHAIIATGSSSVALPGISLNSPGLMNSTAALGLAQVPKKLLVIGGGYIGLELGSVYSAFGSEVSVVEMMEGIIPQADRDLAQALQRSLKDKFHQMIFQTKVTGIVECEDGLKVRLQGKDHLESEMLFDSILVSVGRKPNSQDIGLDRTSVQISDKGFVRIDNRFQTDAPGIYAIGDVVGEPMLAHKASHEAREVVETIAGNKEVNKTTTIPAVIFTNPEVAWCGLTETEAKAKGIVIEVAKFPWLASGRAMTLDCHEGFTKLLMEPKTDRVLGVAIVGPHAGDLISEGVLAVEKKLKASDLTTCIHPHPTLSETMMEAAELFYGHCTHLYKPRRK